MSDTVWATLISVIGMLGTTYLTNWFNSRSAKRAADIAADQSATQWERSESTRKDQDGRDEARRQQAHRASCLRECWGHVLATRIQIQKMRRNLRNDEPVAAQEWPTVTSGHACAVALIELPEIYWLLRDLHEATLHMEMIAVAPDLLSMDAGWWAWDKSFVALEKAVAKLSGIDWDDAKVEAKYGFGLPDPSSKVV